MELVSKEGRKEGRKLSYSVRKKSVGSVTARLLRSLYLTSMLYCSHLFTSCVVCRSSEQGDGKSVRMCYG